MPNVHVCETKNTFTHVVYDMVIDELRKELERQNVVPADYDTSPDHDARRDELEMLRAELGKKSMMPERACEAYESTTARHILSESRRREG